MAQLKCTDGNYQCGGKCQPNHLKCYIDLADKAEYADQTVEAICGHLKAHGSQVPRADSVKKWLDQAGGDKDKLASMVAGHINWWAKKGKGDSTANQAKSKQRDVFDRAKVLDNLNELPDKMPKAKLGGMDIKYLQPKLDYDIEDPAKTKNANFDLKLIVPYTLDDARFKDKEMGNVEAYVTGTFEDPKTILLKEMGADPSLQGKGIARALIGKLIAQSPEGATIVTSGVYSPQGKAVMASMVKDGLAKFDGTRHIIDVDKAKAEFSKENISPTT